MPPYQIINPSKLGDMVSPHGTVTVTTPLSTAIADFFFNQPKAFLPVGANGAAASPTATSVASYATAYPLATVTWLCNSVGTNTQTGNPGISGLFGVGGTYYGSSSSDTSALPTGLKAIQYDPEGSATPGDSPPQGNGTPYVESHALLTGDYSYVSSAVAIAHAKGLKLIFTPSIDVGGPTPGGNAGSPDPSTSKYKTWLSASRGAWSSLGEDYYSIQSQQAQVSATWDVFVPAAIAQANTAAPTIPVGIGIGINPANVLVGSSGYTADTVANLVYAYNSALAYGANGFWHNVEEDVNAAVPTQVYVDALTAIYNLYLPPHNLTSVPGFAVPGFAVPGELGSATTTTGTGTAVASFAGSATGSVIYHVTATASGTFSASLAGTVVSTATATASGAFSASTTGTVRYPTTGSVAASFAGAATATVIYPTTASAAGTFAATTIASVRYLTTGSVTASFAGSATASVRYPTTGSTAGTFTSSLTATVIYPMTGSVAGSFVGMLAASVSGIYNGTGIVVGSFSSSAMAGVTYHLTGSVSAAFAGSTTGTVLGLVSGTGSTVGTFAAQAVGSVIGSASASASASFTAQTTATVIYPMTGSVDATFQGTATTTVVGIYNLTGSATGSFTATATAFLVLAGTGSANGTFSSTMAGYILGAPRDPIMPAFVSDRDPFPEFTPSGRIPTFR